MINEPDDEGIASVSVIGEPGSTHCGNIERMFRAIGVAEKAHADAVKFQFVSNSQRLAARRQAPEYREAYELIKFPSKFDQLLYKLRRVATDAGLKFGCTVYLPEDVKEIAGAVDFLKISSFEAMATDIQRAMVDEGVKVPIYVSVGMLNDLEINELLCVLRDISGYQVLQHKLLHCVSAYPAKQYTMQLGRLHERTWFDGLSDHSRCVLTGAVAVGAGARTIETHYRAEEDYSCKSPDYEVSFSAKEFEEYVNNVYIAEEMMGEDCVKFIGKCEEDMRKYRVCN